MITEQIIGLLLALLVMLVGLAGTMIPGVPGVPLVWLATGAHRLWFGDAGVSNTVLIILTLLTLVSLGIDYVASVLGARKLGATWRGVLGAVLGAMIGILFSIPGVIIGPFVGAVAFEMLGGREWKEAARAGVGALVGVFVGAFGKAVCCAIMIGLFAINVISRSAPRVDVEI
ncbi:MAG: DUF456 domain-containing protein [Verrucomicrobia bacterium]|nr:DUF456 domain-containing protein [Verrucomicrobiota bacterium]